MHSFEYHGHIFRSIREACKALNVHYSKARRIYRTYQRAQDDPALIFEWTASGIPLGEKITYSARRDRRLTAERVAAYRERRFDEILNS